MKYASPVWSHETPPLEQPIRGCVVIWIAAQTAAVHGFLRDVLSRIDGLPGFELGQWTLQDSVVRWDADVPRPKA